MELIIIAAMAANRVIGFHNTIPWRIPEEMAHFKATTMGHSLIMGRKTYQAIGGPLPGRRTVVISRDPAFPAHPSCAVVTSLADALAACADEDEVYVIGGEQIYRLALPLVDTLILTVIGQDYTGDAFFPDLTGLPLVCTDRRPLPAAVPLIIETYRRHQG